MSPDPDSHNKAMPRFSMREHHQNEAMKAAYLVAHQFTPAAKKQVKRNCLAHLTASLAMSARKNKADSV